MASANNVALCARARRVIAGGAPSTPPRGPARLFGAIISGRGYYQSSVHEIRGGTDDDPCGFPPRERRSRDRCRRRLTEAVIHRLFRFSNDQFVYNVLYRRAGARFCRSSSQAFIVRTKFPAPVLAGQAPGLTRCTPDVARPFRDFHRSTRTSATPSRSVMAT